MATEAKTNYSNINVNGELMNLMDVTKYVERYRQTLFDEKKIGYYVRFYSLDPTTGKTLRHRSLCTKDGVGEPFETVEVKLDDESKYRGQYMPEHKAILGTIIMESYVDL
jgi:hypothetical protein